MGYTTVDAASVEEAEPTVMASEDCLENELLRVRFDDLGAIVSIYDKALDREVIASGQRANRLAVYADLGDAWDFPMDYAASAPRHMELISAVPEVDGPRAAIQQLYRLGHSELMQEIALEAGSRALVFRSRARWRETASMLRASFPVSVHAEEASFEIQYGHVRRPTHRNTTWDLARDEVVGHKWADLSQGDYGVALLNDCKYGHKIKGNVLDLNLLRSVPYPGPRLVQDENVAPGEPHHGYTDQCDHAFTYALYPHPGSAVEGGVIQAGYELNVPLRTTQTDPHAGSEPPEASFISVSAPNVIVETVKHAEDGDDLVLRLYESTHAQARVLVRFGFAIQAAAEVNLMEEDPRPLEVAGDGVALELRPFEIKTLRLTLPSRAR
jgi:alpha-mannosidase